MRGHVNIATANRLLQEAVTLMIHAKPQDERMYYNGLIAAYCSILGKDYSKIINNCYDRVRRNK